MRTLTGAVCAVWPHHVKAPVVKSSMLNPSDLIRRVEIFEEDQTQLSLYFQMLGEVIFKPHSFIQAVVLMVQSFFLSLSYPCCCYIMSICYISNFQLAFLVIMEPEEVKFYHI